MRTLIDCHVHTRRCGHAIGTTSDYLEVARDKGISAVVMTEHLSLPKDLDPDGCYSMAQGEIDEYVEEVLAAASAFPMIEVVVGAESDWIPSRSAETVAARESARSAGVSVLSGSVHFLDGWAFDDPDLVGEWDSRDVRNVWESYFSQWCAAVSSGEFDVMAHPDLVKKFGHRPDTDTSELYLEAARCAREADVAVEISTAGLRKPVHELYPGPELLRAFFDAGVPVTVGSDAHEPAEIGYSLDLAYDAAYKAGYREILLPLGRSRSRSIPL